MWSIDQHSVDQHSVYIRYVLRFTDIQIVFSIFGDLTDILVDTCIYGNLTDI